MDEFLKITQDSLCWQFLVRFHSRISSKILRRFFFKNPCNPLYKSKCTNKQKGEESMQIFAMLYDIKDGIYPNGNNKEWIEPSQLMDGSNFFFKR